MFLTKPSLLIDALLSVAYPHACRLCGKNVESRAFGVVCSECWKLTRLFSELDPICWKCGGLLPGRTFVDPVDLRCRTCELQSFTAARSCGLYEKALRQSVLELKRRPNLASYLRSLLQNIATQSPLNQATRIIPVPLHRRRQRDRGFNQAAVIARSVSAALKVPIDKESLVRSQFSEKHRAGLDAQGRRDTVVNAFVITNQRLIQNERILLIDDVLTTGATASSCASALADAGAGSVYVLTIARSRL